MIEKQPLGPWCPRQPHNNTGIRRAGFVLLLLFGLGASTGCQSLPFTRTVPVTGRSQLLMISEPNEISKGVATYQEILSSEPETTNEQYREMVNRVGWRIANVAARPDYQWEFRVIASAEQNAFCLPGGKVAIYEGILPICETESGLAVVMSHEIAHALARHGGERMTHQMAVNGAKMAIDTTLDIFIPGQYAPQRALFNQAYGLGSKVGVILPYSRKHESEADHVGMLLMAQAGYDPGEAPRFWNRFAVAQGPASSSPLFSTHPASERRAADLMALLPEAQAQYELAPEKLGRGAGIPITQVAQLEPAAP